MTQEERREFTERYVGDCAVAIDESWAKSVLARDKELRERGFIFRQFTTTPKG